MFAPSSRQFLKRPYVLAPSHSSKVTEGRSSHEVDILIGTPMKLLELDRGRGWIEGLHCVPHPEVLGDRTRNGPQWKMWSGSSSMKQTFCLVCSILLIIRILLILVEDPDFEASTRQLLADIAAAKGQPVPLLPFSPVSINNTRPTSDSPPTDFISLPSLIGQRDYSKFRE